MKGMMRAADVYGMLRAKIQGVEKFVSDSAIKIDDTLTQSGQAADAKATGDAIAEKMDKAITDSVTGLGYDMTLEDGILTFTEV